MAISIRGPGFTGRAPPSLHDFNPVITPELLELYPALKNHPRRWVQYCKIRNTRPDFKEETLEVIKRIVGDRKLKRFSKADAHYFEKERANEVSNATVNRDLSVLSNMLTFAWRKELIPVNPMLGYGKLPVDETVRRILEPNEERLIVQKTLEVDYTVGAYVGILGETGLRMEEGMNLKRYLFDTKRRRLTVEASKNYKTRVGLLSDYAIELFSGLTVIVGNPHVFVRLSTMERLHAPCPFGKPA